MSDGVARSPCDHSRSGQADVPATSATFHQRPSRRPNRIIVGITAVSFTGSQAGYAGGSWSIRSSSLRHQRAVGDSVQTMAERWSIVDEDRLLSGSEVRALLSRHVERGQLATYLHSDGGRLLSFVSNGNRSMVVLMGHAGDPGGHAVTPGAVGSSSGFVLENGQEDTYDDADTVPLPDALAAVSSILDTGRPPRGMPWTVDR